MSKTIYANNILRPGGQLPRADMYLFWGEDTLSRRRLEQKAREENLQAGGEDFDLTVFYGADTRADEILEQLDMQPMMSPKRVVVVRNADELRPDDIKKLQRYVDNPSKQAVFVLTAEKVDQRKAFWKALSAKAAAVRCTPPWEPRDIERWMQDEIRTSGRQMDRDAIQLFAESVELNYETAWREWEKLLLFTGERRRITSDDVMESIGQLRTFSVYELQDALGRRDVKRALHMLENILSGGESLVFLVAVLTRFYQTIWRIHALRKGNLSEEEVRQRALKGVFPRFQDRFIAASRHVKPQSMPRVFEALYDADNALKSTGDQLDRFLAEILVWRLCREV